MQNALPGGSNLTSLVKTAASGTGTDALTNANPATHDGNRPLDFVQAGNWQGPGLQNPVPIPAPTPEMAIEQSPHLQEVIHPSLPQPEITDAEAGNMFGPMDDSFNPLPGDFTELPLMLHDLFRSSQHAQHGSYSGTATPRGLLELGADYDLNLNTIDFDCLGLYNEQNPFTVNRDDLPRNLVDKMSPDAVKAFSTSVWRFVPSPASMPEFQGPEMIESGHELTVVVDQRTTAERLDHPTRDKMLGIMFRVWAKVASLAQSLTVLPSLILMDSLLQFFLTSKGARVTSWIHAASV